VKVTRRERRIVLIYALLLVALTSAPYLLAWAMQGTDWVFSGFLIGAEDGNSYLGKMRLGARGLWHFHLLYTAEVHQGASLIFLPYILPGQMAQLFVAEDDPKLTAALVLIFHAMRAVFDILLILVMYRFIAVFLRRPAARMLALVLATLGGGPGWLLSLLGQSHWLGTLPPEFYIPEGFSFIILFSLPHLALARSALLAGFLTLFAAVEKSSQMSPHTGRHGVLSPFPARGGPGARVGTGGWLPHAVLAGICWLVVGLSVPFYLVIVYCLVSAWLLAGWMRTRRFPTVLFTRCAVAAAITLPLFAYFTLVFSTNLAFARWSAQNLLPSPHPLHYVLAYSVLGGLAVIGGRWAWRRGSTAQLLLVGWVVVAPFLVYLPLNVQRRMAEAVIVPLAILAVAGLHLLSQRWAQWRHTSGYRRSWRRARNLALALTIPSSLFLLLGSVLATLKHDRPLFYPAAEVAALDWLNIHAEPDAVVLSSKTAGNLIPAFTGLRVYVGHGPETLDAVNKEAVVVRFYRDDLTADERCTLFETMRIRYVFFGTAERELAGDANDEPAWQNGLTLVYDQEGNQIYEVSMMSKARLEGVEDET
jgi:hypothetical protein